MEVSLHPPFLQVYKQWERYISLGRNLYIITDEMLIHYQDSTRGEKIQIFQEDIPQTTSVFITFAKQVLREYIFWANE